MATIPSQVPTNTMADAARARVGDCFHDLERPIRSSLIRVMWPLSAGVAIALGCSLAFVLQSSPTWMPVDVPRNT